MINTGDFLIIYKAEQKKKYKDLIDKIMGIVDEKLRSFEFEDKNNDFYIFINTPEVDDVLYDARFYNFINEDFSEFGWAVKNIKSLEDKQKDLFKTHLLILSKKTVNGFFNVASDNVTYGFNNTGATIGAATIRG